MSVSGRAPQLGTFSLNIADRSLSELSYDPLGAQVPLFLSAPGGSCALFGAFGGEEANVV